MGLQLCPLAIPTTFEDKWLSSVVGVFVLVFVSS